MEATQCLRDEHQIILKVLECFEIAIREAREANTVTRATFGPFVEFFRGFADKCHHCKEEDRLFPKMEGVGIPREGGPIGVMLAEHERGRLHVRTIDGLLDAAEGEDADAVNGVLLNGAQFLAMLREHIDKEDHCLFGMADQLIQSNALTELTTAYTEAEREPEYSATFNRCRAIANDLMEKYAVAKL